MLLAYLNSTLTKYICFLFWKQIYLHNFLNILLKMKREEIINEFERTYKNEGLPHLAGKIIGVFYVSDKKYLSFKEINENIDASKGTVSKVLKFLIKLNRVKCITHEKDKRKRYYCLDIPGLIQFLKYIISNYEEQSTLLEEVVKIRGNEYEELDIFIDKSINFNNEMLDFLKLKSEEYFG